MGAPVPVISPALNASSMAVNREAKAMGGMIGISEASAKHSGVRASLRLFYFSSSRV